MSVTVTANAIYRYRETLRKISDKAAQEVQDYMLKHRFLIDDSFIDFAYAIATKYGEAAGALSCEFYERLQRYWSDIEKGVAAYNSNEYLVPASTPSIAEVAKTVNGVKKVSVAEIPGAISRLVKRTAEDTTLQNAKRSGVEFAWIPAGDTCAFCLALAARGWQTVSKETLKNGHAEHIHANCDCTYVVRFSPDMNVAGYDPEEYESLYESAEGSTPEAKINSMRREFYAENSEEINEQKRSAYEKRKERESSEAEEINVS